MYDFRFYQACMGQTQLVIKLGWRTMGFIGENLRGAKGLRFFFSNSHTGLFFKILGFNRYKEWMIQLD
jgi:hypothetical protein